MAWIEGTKTQTIKINVPSARVLEYFSTPTQFGEAYVDAESIKHVEDNVYTFTLVEKAEKGIKFQGVYTVKYTVSEDRVDWTHLGEGNMRTTGSVVILGHDDTHGTELTYTETLSPDLPIPKLMARVFKPIVSRQISAGIGTFLERSKAQLEA